MGWRLTIRDNGIQTDKEIQNPVCEPKIAATPQFVLQSESEISHIDEYQNLEENRGRAMI